MIQILARPCSFDGQRMHELRTDSSSAPAGVRRGSGAIRSTTQRLFGFEPVHQHRDPTDAVALLKPVLVAGRTLQLASAADSGLERAAAPNINEWLVPRTGLLRRRYGRALPPHRARGRPADPDDDDASDRQHDHRTPLSDRVGHRARGEADGHLQAERGHG